MSDGKFHNTPLEQMRDYDLQVVAKYMGLDEDKNVSELVLAEKLSEEERGILVLALQQLKVKGMQTTPRGLVKAWREG